MIHFNLFYSNVQYGSSQLNDIGPFLAPLVANDLSDALSWSNGGRVEWDAPNTRVTYYTVDKKNFTIGLEEIVSFISFFKLKIVHSKINYKFFLASPLHGSTKRHNNSNSTSRKYNKNAESTRL